MFASDSVLVDDDMIKGDEVTDNFEQGFGTTDMQCQPK